MAEYGVYRKICIADCEPGGKHIGGFPIAHEKAGDGDASMLMRRLVVVRFMTRVAKPLQHITECASCFAHALLFRTWSRIAKA